MGRSHKENFAKLEVMFWLNDGRVRSLCRQHRADYTDLCCQAVAQRREIVRCLPDVWQHFGRQWGVKRQTIDRSLAALGAGDDPLIKVLSDTEIEVCGYSKVVSPSVCEPAEITKKRDVDVDVDQDKDKKEDQDVDVEEPVTTVAHMEGSNDKATTTTTAPQMERELDLARSALKGVTKGWRLNGRAMAQVYAVLYGRPKEVLAYAKQIGPQPDTTKVKSPWSLLSHRLRDPDKKGYDPPQECFTWAANQLRYE